MSNTDTVLLVERAKAGDHKAWSELCERYYPRWIAAWHGKLGPVSRRLYDTQDLIQSAMALAIRDIRQLENDAAFFVWVTMIIRHKLYDVARRNRFAQSLESFTDSLAGAGDSFFEQLAKDDELRAVIAAVDALFPRYPTEMATIYLQYLRELQVAEIAEVLDKSERSVARITKRGRQLLRVKLGIQR